MYSDDVKKQKVKEILKKLHMGFPVKKLAEEFKDILEDVSPAEIAKIEDELVKEGMPREEIQGLCELHIEIFKESIEKAAVSAPPGHPINTLMEEHKILLDFASNLERASSNLRIEKDNARISEWMKAIEYIVKHLKESEKHYLREENVLFPYIEKHGISEPPKVMWSEHDKIRAIKKEIYDIYERDVGNPNELGNNIIRKAIELAEITSSHFFKENNILFPAAMKVIPPNEWQEISAQFEEVGYCCFTPQSARKGIVETKEGAVMAEGETGRIEFETGSMSKEEIEAIFSTLPVDISFVDAEDKVRFFSQTKDRIFVRTKAVIGRSVQNCHPSKSVDKVNQILNDFRAGKRDVTEFWLNLGGKMVHIRYFPLRDKNGKYLGCLEVTQDITEIQKLQGEKRLL